MLRLLVVVPNTVDEDGGLPVEVGMWAKDVFRGVEVIRISDKGMTVKGVVSEGSIDVLLVIRGYGHQLIERVGNVVLGAGAEIAN